MNGNFNAINGVNGVSRALQEASGRKARKLTFYKNGEPFSHSITVSILPGRDFRTLEQLCAYLTDKIKIANGVQFIFTTNGQRVLTLNELEHGQNYVVSGVKNFQTLNNIPYGQHNKLKQIGVNSQILSDKSKAVREDDLKLLRPLSSKYNTVYHNITQPINTSYREGRIITIVNNRDHKLRSRVLLNLKSPKSFDIIVKDLGQAVRIKNAKRMFTASGHEVRSVSQLKRDMIGIELFYLESDNSQSSQISLKSHSLESINQKNASKGFSSSNDFIHQNSIKHKNYNQIVSNNESNGEHNSMNTFKRSDSNINPSRRGESSLSERFSLNIESMAENEYQNGYKTAETQTQTYSDLDKLNQKNFNKKSNKPNVEQTVYKNDYLLEKTAFDESLSQRYLKSYIETAQVLSPQSSPTHHMIHHISPKHELMHLETKKSHLDLNATPIKTQKQKPNDGNKKSYQNKKSHKQKPNENVALKGSVVLSSTDVNDLLRRDALHEYAETLLRETAFLVQNESFKQESVEDNNNKVIPIITTQSNSPNKSESVLRSDSKPNSRLSKSNKSYENEMISKSKAQSDSDEDEEHAGGTGVVPNDIKAKSMPNISSPQNIQRSISPKIIQESTPNRQIIPDLKNPIEYLKDGTDIPDKYIQLKWVHGFNGNNGSQNLFILSNGDLTYFVGTVAVLWNPETNTQRLYTLHTNDINRMAVRQSKNMVATSQEAGNGEPFAVVRVWSAKDLRTYAVLTQNVFGLAVTALDLSQQGSLLVINSEQRLNLTIWDTKSSEIINSSRRELKGGETVRGTLFHQTEDDIMVTYGNKHLTIWQRKRDGTIDCRTAIKPDSKTSKSINCVDFLPDHSLLTGDTTGSLTIWAPLEDENGVLEFVVKEVKGHDKSLTCLQLLQNNILISGDIEGTVKTWDVNDEQFRLLNAIKLPPTSGSISAITRVYYPNADNDTIEIYIGTSMNLILRGSALQATNYTVIFEGHSLAVRGLAVDPKNESFYSSALDQKVCKWSQSNLVWRTTTESQCVSASVHPSGQVLAIGSVSGTIFIMNTSDGNIVSQLPVSQVCIGCLAYSPDGDLLAAGCQDGILYILPCLENGYAYEKVSVLKGPFAILSLQWAIDSQFILTSVNENNYQELLLWDLPNCRYMKGVSNISDNIVWFDPTCSGGEDVRGIWDNRYLQEVVNLSCHCSPSTKYVVSGDEEGVLRLFSYPCSDSKAAFFEYRQGGGSVTEVRFSFKENLIFSGNFTGSLFVWQLAPFDNTSQPIG